MTILLKLPLDLSIEVDVPVISTPATRSPSLTLEIAEALAEQARYQKRDADGDGDIDTFCNFLVREGLKMFGVDVPRMLANDLHDYLLDMRGQAKGFVKLPTEWLARKVAETGCPVVVAWKNTALRQTPRGLVASPGHVGLVVPARPQDPKSVTWIAQAGADTFAHGTLTRGFGTRHVTFAACP